MKKIALPKDVSYILQTLNQHGFEAYIVGGCVRDSLLGIAPKDWDITTSAKPEETKKLFTHTFDTGIQHGTITVVRNHENYEITTYRIEGEYEDCRRPDYVEFTSDLKEDLLRRDFTMNAIAYHPEEGFQDPFSGQMDIQNKTIRGVGEPAKRFQEDALRMLRCIRFGVQLGFVVEPETKVALSENVALIQKISVERIKDELEKTWISTHMESLPLLWESGLLEQVDGYLCQKVLENPNLLEQLQKAPKHPHFRWALVLQNYDQKALKSICKGLKFDNDGTKVISTMALLSQQDLPTKPYEMRQLLSKYGDIVDKIITLQEILRPESTFSTSRTVYETILADGDCLTLKQLEVDGQALMDMGIPKGKQIGQMLNHLLDLVHQNPEWNTKEQLEQIVTAVGEDIILP
ncbi:CCA tRNA nucleotidyltransferase [Chakrabartyella piscis]|uniref:CCA tRNA nucleotidyltransferase n=1 Tax=Chakrabartyella piscis TaxID=2918914 RepID=UPI0029584D4C|nr:CCA tRNA nucleotidyltransferase [Chakrabartyella piscis]